MKCCNHALYQALCLDRLVSFNSIISKNFISMGDQPHIVLLSTCKLIIDGSWTNSCHEGAYSTGCMYTSILTLGTKWRLSDKPHAQLLFSWGKSSTTQQMGGCVGHSWLTFSLLLLLLFFFFQMLGFATEINHPAR
jgi:hypothetical protein